MCFTLRAKLAASFGLVVCLSTAVGVVSIQSLISSHATVRQLVDVSFAQSKRLGTIRAYISDVGRLVSTLDVVDDEAVFVDLRQTAIERAGLAEDLIRDHRQNLSADRQASMEEMAANAVAYSALASKVVDLLKTERSDPAANAEAGQQATVIARDEMAPTMSRMVDQLKEETTHADGLNASMVADPRQAYEVHRNILIALVTAAILMGGAAALWMALSISRASSFAMSHVRKIGSGNISERIVHDRNDEIGDRLTSLCQMRLKLSDIVSDVRGSATQVASGSAQSALTAEQLSSGSSEQAAASEEASAASRR